MTNNPKNNVDLSAPLTLKNGTVIKNRIMKSAMSEVLATADNRPTEELIKLYEVWAKGGTGLLVSGNIMVDKRYLGEPNNLAIEDESDLPMLEKLAQAGTWQNTEFWVQLNHPGKQTMRTLTKEPIAPSAIPFRKEMQAYFATPREMTEAEILDVIKRFGRSAEVAKKAGFTGIQIHAAHGYLVSQFLSGHHNQRTDQWGGSPENRRRFVLEVYREIREKVGNDFPVGIKLNSADFQRGGFSEDESLDVIRALTDAGIDLIEISGGTYEAPAMATKRYTQKQSTREREAYFLDFAEKARQATAVPLVVTGGFRSVKGINEALQSGAVDMIGLGRLLAIEPDAPLRLLAGQNPKHSVKPITTGLKMVDKMALMEIMWYARQMKRLATGKAPKPNEPGFVALLGSLLRNGVGTIKTKRLRAS